MYRGGLAGLQGDRIQHRDCLTIINREDLIRPESDGVDDRLVWMRRLWGACLSAELVTPLHFPQTFVNA